ncbi:fungal pheromone STE3G-protein-coupled receptor [Peniophora sp. CONT]|nr:fungal pheromone STE3G-protein-coupled receptor [Peniophora sp. CONT]
MGAANPTYPLYPFVCILTSAMLLLVSFTDIVRQRWNLGIEILCFWLFIENLTSGINAIVWAGNFDVKFEIYCDIGKRIFVVKPMSTLIVTRQLYTIASLHSVGPSKVQGLLPTRGTLFVEGLLGLVIPVLIAGPLYYIVQDHRFVVIEGLGCTNTQDDSVLAMLLIASWSVTIPILSVIIYYREVAWVFYHKSREVNRFLRSRDSGVSRAIYMRILALASIDILVTLPLGIVTIVLQVLKLKKKHSSVPFYSGWDVVHSDWQPVGVSYAEALSRMYFTYWTSPLLAFIIFVLFGLATDARATYRRIIRAISGKPTQQQPGPVSSTLGPWRASAHEMVMIDHVQRQCVHH